jgi:hypothetical protein
MVAPAKQLTYQILSRDEVIEAFQRMPPNGQQRRLRRLNFATLAPTPANGRRLDFVGIAINRRNCRQSVKLASNRPS